MSESIDIFYSAASPSHPYIAFVVDDDNGMIVTSEVHHQITTVAEWCRSRELPVRAHDRWVRAELRDFGIQANPDYYNERILGSVP